MSKGLSTIFAVFFFVAFGPILTLTALQEITRLVTSSRGILGSELGLVSRTCESNNWASSDDLFYRTDYCREIVGGNFSIVDVRKGFDAKSIKTESDWIYWKR
jgi:hypothetical protein